MNIAEVFNIDDINSPKGENNLGAFSSFYWRDLYKSFTFPEELESDSIDLWYERMFYGRIDHDNIPIYPSETALKQLRATNTIFASVNAERLFRDQS